MHAIVSYQRIFQITDRDSTLIPIPIYLVTGLVALLGLTLYAGGTVYLHKFFDAKRVLRDVNDKEITFLHSAPAVFSLLLRKRTVFLPFPVSGFWPAEAATCQRKTDRDPPLAALRRISHRIWADRDMLACHHLSGRCLHQQLHWFLGPSHSRHLLLHTGRLRFTDADRPGRGNRGQGDRCPGPVLSKGNRRAGRRRLAPYRRPGIF